MISRDGVFYDLTKSIHRSTQNELTFVFSSKLHKDKFESRLEDNRKTINKSLSNRFKIKVDVPVLADIVLYRKIETRGFLIVKKGSKMQWRNVTNITCDGGKVTLNSSSEQ